MARQVAEVVAVVVASRLLALLIGLLTVGVVSQVHASVLPEQRADILYHHYSGGGITIQGPAVLVRKNFNDKVSVSAKYYVDQISSASIDVVTTASPYTEQRTEYNVSTDYLLNKTIISGGFTDSTENDYKAKTYNFGISQDFFGDLSTLKLNYSYGDNNVYNSLDPTFHGTNRSQNYDFNWTQVMTKNLLMGFEYNIITSEGYLQSPYRSVRYLIDSNDPSQGYLYQKQVYPSTHTSQAFAIRSRYFLPYRAAFSMEYRRYNDTWDINAYNIGFGYTQPYKEHWIFGAKYRYYTQGAASFYSDLFPAIDYQQFFTRDKELSQFHSNDFSLIATYNIDPKWAARWVDKATANLAIDYMMFSYDNYRDLRVKGVTPGTEPLYKFNATVTRLFFSAWF